MINRKKLLSDLLLLIVAMIWGASFTIMKNVINIIPESLYLAIRFLVATFALMIIFRSKLKLINLKYLKFGSIIGLMLFLGMFLQVVGLRYTTPTKAAFLTALNFVFVPIISALVLKKKSDRLTIIGLVLSFGGIFFLSGGIEFNFNLGDWLNFLCAFFFAMQIIYIDKYTSKNEDATIVAIVQIAFASFLFIAVFLVTDFQSIYKIGTLLQNPLVLFTILFTGLLGTALAFFAQTTVQKYTSPTHTAVILSAEPVFGALFAMLIPDLITKMTESFTLFKMIGCMMMFLGILICEIGTFRKNASLQ